MRIRLIIQVYLLLACAAAYTAPIAGNVKHQEAKGAKIEVTYDLSGATGPVMASVVLSRDHGETWDVIPDLRALSGDLGTSVTNGKGKRIIWDAGKDPAKKKEAAGGYQVKVIVSEIGRTKTINLPGGVKLEMVRIPAGTFLMGSDTSGIRDETPRHMVYVEKDFYLGKTEVSQRQWEAVMESNPSNIKGNPELPVEAASWDICAKFVERMNTLGRGAFRMPSEAEWEYACRAGTTTKWFFGDDPKELVKYAWTGADSRGTTHAVGGKLPNPFGLHDILGGVFEWVADWYHDDYTGAPTDGSAWDKKDEESPWRVCRGGAFHLGENVSTPAYRTVQYPNENQSWYGLRIAMDAD